MTLLFLSCLYYCSPKKYVSFFIYFILCYTFILLHVLLYPHNNTNYFFLNKKLIMGIMVITILLIWRRAFLYRFGCQKVFLAVLLGRWHKRILCKWLLYDGEETQKSWKPMLNTIFALRGSHRNAPYNKTRTIFFVPSAKRHCQEDLLTPESYMLKKKLHKSGSKSYFYAIIVLLVYASICKPMRKHKTYLFLL